MGIINVHASLLPKYRGAAPIQWAIARGETRTGVTTMRINEGLDTGDMLLQWETEIGPEETAVGLGRTPGGGRRGSAGAHARANLSTIRPEPQDDSQATYAPILKKEDGKIDWHLSPAEILNRIRGFEPWPGGYGFLRGQRFQIWKAAEGEAKLAPGALRAVRPEAVRRLRGRRIHRIAGGSIGRKEENAGGGVLERISLWRRTRCWMSQDNLPLGFRYAATYAGIRKVAKDDLALIVSDTPAAAAAVFTQNRVVAAPVTLARKNLRAVARQSTRDSG